MPPNFDIEPVDMNVLEILLLIVGWFKIIIVVCIVVFVILLAGKNTYLKHITGENSNYFTKYGMVHYAFSGKMFSLVWSPVLGAHTRTFQAIKRNFGKDRKYIYYQTAKQKHVDRETFYIDDENTPKDRHHAYICQAYPPRLLVINGADPATYRLIPPCFGRDANFIYFHTEKQEHVDAANFEVKMKSTKTPAGDEREEIDHIKDRHNYYTVDYANHRLQPQNTNTDKNT